MNTLKRLFGSRKFVTALIAIAADVLIVLNVEPALADKLVIAVTTLAGLFIAGTAFEDAAEKRNTNVDVK